ncbi:hypothetical protein CCACVL1_16223 [Corchorus capsularis]|uniref:Uncharacterized protein n=1 Tax=Corchorus capsularis TaxID=210143 RepID=A0A1R3HYA7_COCAP|nr:hypothetical protein CCACVL1_16223 [Corchorus capsularis]
MDEIQINSAAGEDEIIGDDFYEKIEAPKFVDLSAPDRCRNHDDDRYWFCLRVGCDQKHEEELDSEAIYKNFVLRVMAARSPSVRLRKAIYSKDKSSNLQCPRTVPAKSSKSRVSRLAMISSISQKMGETKVKVRTVPKQDATTPNVKAAKERSVKALTTPRNKKGLSNPGTFRSVRNPKPTKIEVPKSKVVAKALVFHSPKKAVKLKKSVELSSSSLRKICAGMKKLEITDGNKKNELGCNKPLDASRKQLRGREVKSRVFDSLYSQNQKKQEAKSSKCLKKKNKEKDLKVSKKGDSTDKEIEAKSKDGSLEVCSTSCTSKNHSGSLEQQEIDEKAKFSSDASRSNLTSLSNSKEMNSGDGDVPKSSNGGQNEISERGSQEENVEPCSTDKEIPETVESDDKENALVSHTEVSESKVMEIDDKENATASDENIKLNCTTGKLVKKNVLGKHETSKSIQKVTKVMSKTLKENSTSAVDGTQGIKYRRPKPTNPKPFRFRTDERGILKEANLERKHQTVQRNEGSENESDLKDQLRTVKSSKIIKVTTERKVSAILQKRTVPVPQKTKVPSLLENSQVKADQKSENRLEKTSIKQLGKPRGVGSSRKKLVSLMKPGQLGTINETSRPKETSEPKGSRTSLATKGRRHTTIPKEPNFHSIHTPKSCTKRVL